MNNGNKTCLCYRLHTVNLSFDKGKDKKKNKKKTWTPLSPDGITIEIMKVTLYSGIKYEKMPISKFLYEQSLNTDFYPKKVWGRLKMNFTSPISKTNGKKGPIKHLKWDKKRGRTNIITWQETDEQVQNPHRNCIHTNTHTHPQTCIRRREIRWEKEKEDNKNWEHTRQLVISGTYVGQDNKGLYFKQEHLNEQKIGKSIVLLCNYYKKTDLSLVQSNRNNENFVYLL